MDSRVLEVISSQIDDQITHLKDYLADGKAKDYAEYREYCGKIRGLLTAVGFTRDLVQKMEQSDD
jgi:hypothetical protein